MTGWIPVSLKFKNGIAQHQVYLVFFPVQHDPSGKFGSLVTIEFIPTAPGFALWRQPHMFRTQSEQPLIKAESPRLGLQVTVLQTVTLSPQSLCSGLLGQLTFGTAVNFKNIGTVRLQQRSFR